MKWFKALSRLYRIPKVRRLKESDRWRYVACLSLAGERDSEDGELPDIPDLSIHLGVTERSLRTSCANIVEVGLFEWDGDDNHVRILKWAEHQNTRKDTQKQYRERQKKAPLRNGDVTDCNRDSLDKSRVDTEKTKDKKEIKTGEDARAKAKPKDVSIVADFMAGYISEKGYSVNPVNAAETFYDHFESNGWKVGGRSAMKDWQAAARKWVRTDAERQSTGKANGIDRRSAQERANSLTTADIAPTLNGALRILEARGRDEGHDSGSEGSGQVCLGDGSGAV